MVPSNALNAMVTLCRNPPVGSISLGGTGSLKAGPQRSKTVWCHGSAVPQSRDWTPTAFGVRGGGAYAGRDDVLRFSGVTWGER